MAMLRQSSRSPPQQLEDQRLPSSTTQFGIQVDLTSNPQIPLPPDQYKQPKDQKKDKNAKMEKGEDAAERRKQMKKQAKRRKRQKEQELQRQARRQIGNIVQQIYEGKACFKDYQGRIETLVETLYRHDFRDYLDQLIRMRVTVVQKSIWEYTQSILDDNPFESNADHAFYSLMIDHLHQRYLQLEESSEEIQKIINLYLKFSYRDANQEEQIVYSNLALNTFNYLVDTDDTLKNLLKICQQKLPVHKVLQRKKLEELISLIDNYDFCSAEDDDDEPSCPSDDHLSTAISEEDQGHERKKRKRKIKESELVTSEDALIRRLDNLIVGDKERQPCRVQEDWVRKMRTRAMKYRLR